jgi:uncharacterized protein (TIGR02646 family)
MIKFSRLDTEKARAAIGALQRAKASKKSYNTPEVNAALAEMFCGKCYICESKEGISSFQIEHLKPHGGDGELKYDWNNLFWSCAHCNNSKNANHGPILDCSLVDVDNQIAFRKEGYFGKDEKYQFLPLGKSEEVSNTIALLQEVYYGSTPQKRMEAVNIRRALRDNLSRFKNLVRAYYEAEEFDKEDIRCAIRREVGKGAAFTAFKRWLLWDHRDTYGEVLEFCDLPQKQLLN